MQARSLRECVPLHTLNLSGCGLTDLSVPYIVNLLKVGHSPHYHSNPNYKTFMSRFVPSSLSLNCGAKQQQGPRVPIPRAGEETHRTTQLKAQQELACQAKLHRVQRLSQQWSSRNFPLQGKWGPSPEVCNLN